MHCIAFAGEKRSSLDKWCARSKANDFEQLCKLIFLKAFKDCLPDKLVLRLNELKVCSLKRAAALADEFVLMHETAFSLMACSKRSPVPTERRRISAPAESELITTSCTQNACSGEIYAFIGRNLVI